MVFYFKSIENRIKRCRLDKAVLQPFLTGIAANGEPLVLKRNRERFFFVVIKMQVLFMLKSMIFSEQN